MECPNCEAKWELKEESVVKRCPFCQYDFTAKQEKQYSADSVEGILQSIVEKYTVEIYQDSSRFKSILSDLMTKEPKMLKLLKLMIDQNVARTLYASRNKSEKEFEMARRKVIVDVADNLFSHEEKMEMGVNFLCVGLGKSVETVFETVEESDPVDTTAWTEEAKEWLKKAKAGDTKNQVNLGEAYEQGKDGMGKDLSLAFYWYEKASRGGHKEAQFKLAKCYYNGNGVEKDLYQAFFWSEKSAESGLAIAQRSLGYMYVNGLGIWKDRDKSFEWYEKAAQSGDVVSQNIIGLCYEVGERVEINLNKAVYWYEKSALGGYEEAQYNLGLCYEYAKGVEKDLDKAFYWYEKSAQGGYMRGQTQLALCYIHGYGVAKDKGKGRKLLKQSADAGELQAIEQYKHIFGAL